LSVLIIGMHRSGTSAITRCVNLMGLSLGDAAGLIPPGPDNPRGFWECRALSAFNERILEAMGGAWDLPPLLEGDWWRDPGLDDMRRQGAQLLQTEGLDSPTACWKDPRNCLTIPFWRDLLPSPIAAVFIWRNPVNVARSLERRNGFDRDHSHALWAIYNTVAMRNLRGLPVVCLRHEALMSEPMRELGRIAAFLSAHGVPHLSVPDQDAIDGFLDSSAGPSAIADRHAAMDAELDDDQRELLHTLGELAGEHAQFEFPAIVERRHLSAQYLVTARVGLGRAQDDIRSITARNDEFLGEIERARRYQEMLESLVARLRRPRVDVMVVNYNGDRWVEGFFASLRACRYPPERLRLVFVDNASRDGSFAHAREAARGLSIPVEFVETGVNAGFTGGYSAAFERGEGEYYFVINSDTEMAPDAIDRLIDRLEGDPIIGIAEARQSPLEHPKYYDPITGHTSWCSGACMMIRARALNCVGRGFDPSYFMYAEDVELSWRMWLHGWRCVYAPEAEVKHFTEHLDPDRDHRIQHYHTMRNGAALHFVYDSAFGAFVHLLAMLRVGIVSRNPWWHRRLTLRALAAAVVRMPANLRKRRTLFQRGPHPFVRFNGWLFGFHRRDLELTESSPTQVIADLVKRLDHAEKRMARDLSLDDHIRGQQEVHVAGVARPAIVVYEGAQVSYEVALPGGSRLSGAVAAPQVTWKSRGKGRFAVIQDGASIWKLDLDLARIEHRRWVPFSVDLEPTGNGCKSRLALRFDEVRNLNWGLWGEVRVEQAREEGSDRDPVDALRGLAVSVVVPTHNRADSFPRVIHRLMAQDIPAERFEVVLVDSHSSDDTPAAAARLAAQYPNLTTCRADRSGAAAARNMGFDRARAPLVVLVDDDILVRRDFLRRVLRGHLKHPDCALLGKIVAPWEDACDPFHRYLMQAQDVNVFDFPDPANVPENYFYTACVAIPRALLGDLRFDEGFTCYGVEDIEFGCRLLAGDGRMVHLPDVEVFHEYYPSFRGYRAKKYKAGYSLGYFLSQHPEMAERFAFGRRFLRYYPIWRLLRTLGAPLAAALYVVERALYRRGPVNRSLFRWWYADLRLQLYGGVRRYRKGKPRPR
jgi:GT2 family glycosyltransferase